MKFSVLKVIKDENVIISKLLLLYKVLPHNPNKVIELEEGNLVCQALSIILAFRKIAKEVALQGILSLWSYIPFIMNRLVVNEWMF